MATYAIGDIHGCYDSFRRLLTRIQFNPKEDRLWLVGDLVNRGPQSADVLRWLTAHTDNVVAVLGNHDLHLLTVRAGFAQARRHDTLDDVLNAADADVLCEWLRRRPLAHYEDGYLLIHAGVLPMWAPDEVVRLAAEAATVIGGDDWAAFAEHLYGDEPTTWDDTLRGHARRRVIVNALTRLRVCTATGQMDLSFRGAPKDIPEGKFAWFDAPARRTAATPIICGHWSALGYRQENNILALDSGCFWGGMLTAVRLSDRRVFQTEAAIPTNTNKPNQ